MKTGLRVVRAERESNVPIMVREQLGLVLVISDYCSLLTAHLNARTRMS